MLMTTLSYNPRYERWTESARRHHLKNIFAATQFHPGSSIASYFCFTNHSLLTQKHKYIIHVLLPFLDQAMFMLRKTEDTACLYNLTERELQILQVLYSGKANKQIARQFNISNQTVRHHVSNILRKMQVTSRTQALGLALSSGIIDL